MGSQGVSELDTAIRHFRALRTKREASTARALQDAFLRASNGLQTQLDGMTAWLDANPDPPLWRVLAEARTRNLLMQAEALFQQYSHEVGDAIHREQSVAVAQAQHDARDLIAKGFGTPPVGVGLPFVALPQQAIGQLTATLQPGAPVRKLLDEFGGDASSIVESELITGVASGRSPRQTARAISDALGGQYDRALLITRTETLRAYRGAQLEVYRANKHLLRGWRWHAALDRRTCAVCIGLHGRLFQTDEPMRPHPACRCSVIPETKSWRDLGYDVPGPDRIIETGPDWFARQPVTTQQDVLGPAAYEAYVAGDVELEDFIRLRRSGTWGNSYVRGSLDRAKERAASRGTKAA
jgi:SPP1 gp7 family putative phage head morphogenesis protein